MRLCVLAPLRRNEPWSFADSCRCAQWPSGNALQLRSGGWIHSLISIGGVQADRGPLSATGGTGYRRGTLRWDQLASAERMFSTSWIGLLAALGCVQADRGRPSAT